MKLQLKIPNSLDMEIKSKLEKINISKIDFSDSLDGIDSLNLSMERWKFLFAFCNFNKDIMIFSTLSNKLVSSEEFKEFKGLESYAYDALRSGCISDYQLKQFCKLTEILTEAKILREVGGITNSEFIDIFLQIFHSLAQKYNAFKKTYLKNRIKDKGLNSRSPQALRAKLATIQNEN